MLTILLVVVLLLAIIFSDQFKFSIDGQFNPNAIISIVLVGKNHILYVNICLKCIYFMWWCFWNGTTRCKTFVLQILVLPLLLSVYLWFVVYTTFLQLQEKQSHQPSNKMKGKSSFLNLPIHLTPLFIQYYFLSHDTIWRFCTCRNFDGEKEIRSLATTSIK